MAEQTFRSPDGSITRTVGLPTDAVKLEARGWTEVKKSAASADKSADKPDQTAKP